MPTNKKISVNKLAEYLSATPRRRRQIIRDQKTPPDFKKARYTVARETIVNHLLSKMSDDSQAMNSVSRLLGQQGGSEFAEQDRALSAEAIEIYLNSCSKIELDGLSVERGDMFSDAAMEISDVVVTMRPDVIINNPETQETVGCIKLHFPKSPPLGKEGRNSVATAFRLYLEQTEGSSVDPQKCFVIDVPQGKISHAPKAYRKRKLDIEAACEEISARWDKE